MQLYRGTRVMVTDVDTLSMAAYSAARRGRQSSKVSRLWHYSRERAAELKPSAVQYGLRDGYRLPFSTGCEGGRRKCFVLQHR